MYNGEGPQFSFLDFLPASTYILSPSLSPLFSGIMNTVYYRICTTYIGASCSFFFFFFFFFFALYQDPSLKTISRLASRWNLVAIYFYDKHGETS
ncbi:hypothetical protein F4775DRAFT_196195 [Biscogniauxia sp. FL1348]|nr:hypothetical protein F4775DRAFT_196195 [Biscogniauxia sp. FL1348]